MQKKISMGQRVHDKAEFYIRRGRRKQLRRLIRKRPSPLESNTSPLVLYSIWFRPALLPWLLGWAAQCASS